MQNMFCCASLTTGKKETNPAAKTTNSIRSSDGPNELNWIILHNLETRTQGEIERETMRTKRERERERESRRSSSSLSDYILDVPSPHKSQTNTASGTTGIHWNLLPGHDGSGRVAASSQRKQFTKGFRETTEQTPPPPLPSPPPPPSVRPTSYTL